MFNGSKASEYVTRQSLLLRLKADGASREIAWSEFYDFYAPIISGFARRMGAQPEEIPDIVQDVMLGFFSVTPEFSYDPARGRFRGYLKTATWRILQRKVGSRLRQRGVSLDAVDPQEFSVESTWNDVWESEHLHRALANVRERYLSEPGRANTFRAFEAFALFGHAPEAIAEQLGISVDSVYAAKSRISKALREEMERLDQSRG